MVERAGRRRSPLAWATDRDRRFFERSLARSLPAPTDPAAVEVWAQMPDEHRDWARRAAAEEVVADDRGHARVVADLQAQVIASGRRQVRRLLVVMPSLAVALTILGVLAGRTLSFAPTGSPGVAIVSAAVVSVTTVVRTARQRRGLDEARTANLARASAGAWPGQREG